MGDDSLRSKTVKGTIWSAADAFLGQGITFVVGLVLARLLSPEEYGLIGICLIFTTILNGIVDSGFSSALIRKQEVSNDDCNTMFIVNMVLSVALYVLLFATAPLVSAFFAREQLTELLRVVGLILIINALSIIQVTILTKRIDFKTKTKASVSASIISGVLGIWMAFYGYGVWALVAQQLSKQGLYTIGLWLLNKWWPNFKFNVASFKYMWGFGWKMLVVSILNSLWNQMYQVVIGKYYSPATLGQYTRARDYANIFSNNLTAIVQRTSFPTLSSIQDAPQHMVAVYRKIIKVTMFVTCVCMLSLAAVSEPLIYFLIGEKWHEASTYLPLICISMSLYPLHALNLNMLQVQGRSDIFLYLDIIKKTYGVIPILIGIFFNIYWMLVASIISGVISFFLNTYYTGKSLGYTSWMQIKDVAIDYLVAIVVAFSIYFFKYLPLANIIILLIQVIVGFLVLVFECESIKLKEYIEVRMIVLTAIKKIKL